MLFLCQSVISDELRSAGLCSPCSAAAVYAVPTTPGRCRAFVRQPFKFKNPLLPKLFSILPAFLGHLGNNDVSWHDACCGPAKERSNE